MSHFSSSYARRLVVALGVIAALSVVVTARTEMPSTQYARAACLDLSRLLEDPSPTERKVSESLMKAAARADRAATVDESFTGLHEEVVRVRDAVEQASPLTESERRTANAAIGAVATECRGLGAGIEAEEAGSGVLTVEDLRQGAGR